MAEYLEGNVGLIRSLIKENKTYKQISHLLKRNYPEVTRGFSERNLQLFCARRGIRKMDEMEVDAIVQGCVSEVNLRLRLFFVERNNLFFQR